MPDHELAQDADEPVRASSDAVVEEEPLIQGDEILTAVHSDPVPQDAATSSSGGSSVIEMGLPGLDVREKALPFRQGDLTRMIIHEPGLNEAEQQGFQKLGKLLGAVFHCEFYDRIHELKELYAPLDPDSDYVDIEGYSSEQEDDTDERFLSRLESTLTQANYRPLTLKAIEEAVTAPNEQGLTYVPDFRLFEHLRVYVRGYTRITREYRSLSTRFRKRRVNLDAYQRMVVALKFKDGDHLGPFVSAEKLYLRMFKDVPHVDMEMHLPEQGTRVRMRWIDRAQIASPLVTGIPTVIAKFLFAATLSPIALGGLLVAPISAGVNSFFGYQRSKRNHLYAMIHRLYYLTIANNASVLFRLIDSAEDEEYKEAMLAYYFLYRAIDDPTPWDVHRLDHQVEQYLREKTRVSVNFEIGDALGKLFRLGLAYADASGHLHARPLSEALVNLDRKWDNTFRYHHPVESSSATKA